MTKRNKIIYWISTLWLSLGMLSTGIVQLFNMKEEVEFIIRLGYPLYFLTLLGIWKILGVAAALIPKFPLLKEWAYAGFFFAMSGAVFSHIACGNGAKEIFGPVLLLILTMVSWYFRPADRKIISVNQSINFQQKYYNDMKNIKSVKKKLSAEQHKELLNTLKARFEKNMNRHKGLEWAKVQAKLESYPEKLWSLSEMEETGGEPDVVDYDKKTGEYIFYDCSEESPKGRRSFCYDREALDARKEHKPKDNAIDMASEIGIELLTEEQYRELQKLGEFDTKTSSWVKTPPAIRKLGGAVFCDRRYDTVFLYHNGAESYYAARGFRGLLRV